MKKISLTTTLPYVNAEPHIGFALEIVQADVMARWYRQQGYDVFFNTGTDEHGLKIWRKSQEEKKEPQAYVDEYAPKFDRLKSALNLSYNSFIRTTDPHHIAAAQEFWRRCAAAGDIYKKQYKVKYCAGCELEKSDSELDHGRCRIHPNLELELIEEENYFFRFSNYQKKLLELYKDDDFVVPDFRLKEIRTFVAGGLQDFSISRLKNKMPWGVPVPDDESQVMYVWFDALVNYISALGWPDKKYSAWWPSVQFAGKDNVRQQSAMWQAMLLSAGIKPSKQVVIHGFVTANGQKISKSLGNVVDPFSLVEAYGPDAVRYFLLRHMHPFEDSDFTTERIRDAYTADLANGLGNLVSRVTNMIERYAGGKLVPKKMKSSAGLTDAMKAYRFDLALGGIWQEVTAANKLIDDTQPWKIAKSGQVGELPKLLNDLGSRLYQVAELLVPFLPETAGKITSLLKSPVTKAEPLFPRLNT